MLSIFTHNNFTINKLEGYELLIKQVDILVKVKSDVIDNYDKYWRIIIGEIN
jgi:hypothetical protein